MVVAFRPLFALVGLVCAASSLGLVSAKPGELGPTSMGAPVEFAFASPFQNSSARQDWGHVFAVEQPLGLELDIDFPYDARPCGGETGARLQLETVAFLNDAPVLRQVFGQDAGGCGSRTSSVDMFQPKDIHQGFLQPGENRLRVTLWSNFTVDRSGEGQLTGFAGPPSLQLRPASAPGGPSRSVPDAGFAVFALAAVVGAGALRRESPPLGAEVERQLAAKRRA